MAEYAKYSKPCADWERISKTIPPREVTDDLEKEKASAQEALRMYAIMNRGIYEPLIPKGIVDPLYYL